MHSRIIRLLHHQIVACFCEWGIAVPSGFREAADSAPMAPPGIIGRAGDSVMLHDLGPIAYGLVSVGLRPIRRVVEVAVLAVKVALGRAAPHDVAKPLRLPACI